jgi:phage terminase small subunit
MGRRGPLKKHPIKGPPPPVASVAGDENLLVPPPGLPSGAKRRYIEIAPILLADRRLLRETQATLATWCRLADEADRIADALEVEGIIRKGPHGTIIDGRCKLLAGIRSAMLKYSTALGLDPAGRARLQSAGVIQQAKTEAELEADALMAKFIG